jgi:hypothetical protein
LVGLGGAAAYVSLPVRVEGSETEPFRVEGSETDFMSNQGKYRTRTTVIDAVQISQDVLSNRELWPHWLGQASALILQHDHEWKVATPEGWRALRLGDWLVRDEGGTMFPLDAALFNARYETAA